MNSKKLNPKNENERTASTVKKKTGLRLISVMLSRSRKKALNKSTRFKIKPKSVYTSHDEGFNENSVSTSRKKLLPLAGIQNNVVFKKLAYI